MFGSPRTVFSSESSKATKKKPYYQAAKIDEPFDFSIPQSSPSRLSDFGLDE